MNYAPEVTLPQFTNAAESKAAGHHAGGSGGRRDRPSAVRAGSGPGDRARAQGRGFAWALRGGPRTFSRTLKEWPRPVAAGGPAPRAPTRGPQLEAHARPAPEGPPRASPGRSPGPGRLPWALRVPTPPTSQGCGHSRKKRGLDRPTHRKRPRAPEAQGTHRQRRGRGGGHAQEALALRRKHAPGAGPRRAPGPERKCSAGALAKATGIPYVLPALSGTTQHCQLGLRVHPASPGPRPVHGRECLSQTAALSPPRQPPPRSLRLCGGLLSIPHVRGPV